MVGLVPEQVLKNVDLNWVTISKSSGLAEILDLTAAFSSSSQGGRGSRLAVSVHSAVEVGRIPAGFWDASCIAQFLEVEVQADFPCPGFLQIFQMCR